MASYFSVRFNVQDMKSCFFVQSSRVGLFECVHAQFARADDDAALNMTVISFREPLESRFRRDNK